MSTDYSLYCRRCNTYTHLAPSSANDDIRTLWFIGEHVAPDHTPGDVFVVFSDDNIIPENAIDANPEAVLAESPHYGTLDAVAPDVLALAKRLGVDPLIIDPRAGNKKHLQEGLDREDLKLFIGSVCARALHLEAAKQLPLTDTEIYDIAMRSQEEVWLELRPHIIVHDIQNVVDIAIQMLRARRASAT